MNLTGQAMNPFPLTRKLFETQSWYSANFSNLRQVCFKPILIRAEAPFFEVIIFSVFSPQTYNLSVTFVPLWWVSRHGYVILYSLSGGRISDNSPSFGQDVAFATQTQFTLALIMMILSEVLCVSICYQSWKDNRSLILSRINFFKTQFVIYVNSGYETWNIFGEAFRYSDVRFIKTVF